MSTLTCNIITQSGPTTLIQSTPIVGLTSVNAYVDNISGETGEEFFTTKLFKYTLNGVIWSDWISLSNASLALVTIAVKDTVIFQFSYTKNTLNPSVSVSEVQLTITTSTIPVSEVYYDKSIFDQFFDSTDTRVLEWYVNVVQKIFAKGLIANYLGRYDQNGDPTSFIDLWESIARFLAYYVIYAREYQNFPQVLQLINEYLLERGLATSEYSTLEDLQLLMESYNKQIFNRGTLHIIDDKVLKGAPVDGELLRVIYYQPQDEFLFNLYKNEHFGWNLGNSSPLHKGLYLNDNIQKFDSNNPTNYIKINDKLNYEISFFIQTSNELTVEIDGFDINQAPLTFTSAYDGSSTNIAYSNIGLQRSDKGIFVRVALYNSGILPTINNVTNLNQGNNLILALGTNYIKLRIQDGSDNIVYPSSLRVLPLFTDYSRGLLQVYNFISIWLMNNNNQNSVFDLTEYVRKYLVPYNSTFEILDLIRSIPYDGTIITTTTTAIPLAWRGIDPSCDYTTTVKPTAWIGLDSYCETNDLPENYYWIGEEDTATCVQV